MWLFLANDDANETRNDKGEKRLKDLAEGNSDARRIHVEARQCEQPERHHDYSRISITLHVLLYC
jgi:hypothetical protein